MRVTGSLLINLRLKCAFLMISTCELIVFEEYFSSQFFLTCACFMLEISAEAYHSLCNDSRLIRKSFLLNVEDGFVVLLLSPPIKRSGRRS